MVISKVRLDGTASTIKRKYNLWNQRTCSVFGCNYYQKKPQNLATVVHQLAPMREIMKIVSFGILLITGFSAFGWLIILNYK